MNLSGCFVFIAALDGLRLPVVFSYWLYVFSVVLVAFTLPIFSYLTLIYRELGRMTTGRIHQHLEIFESESEEWCTSSLVPGNLSSSSSYFLCSKSSLRCTLFRTCCCTAPQGAGCCLFCRWFAGPCGSSGRCAYSWKARNRWRVFRNTRPKRPRSSARKRASKRWWKPRKKKASSSRNRRT